MRRPKTTHRRLVAWSISLGLVCLGLALAGCGGGGTPDAPSSDRATDTTETTTAAAATDAGACAELTALARVVGPTLRVTPTEAVMAKSDVFRNASSALFEHASRAPEDIKTDISIVSAGWDDVAGRLSELELSGSPDATSVNLTNEHIRETLAEPGYMDSSARVLAWLNSEAAKCPDSDATDQALGGKQLGEVDDAATAAVNEALSQRTEVDAMDLAPLGAEVRNCRKVRELSENALIAPGGTGYSCEVWFEGEMKVDAAPAVLDANGKVATIP